MAEFVPSEIGQKVWWHSIAESRRNAWKCCTLAQASGAEINGGIKQKRFSWKNRAKWYELPVAMLRREEEEWDARVLVATVAGIIGSDLRYNFRLVLGNCRRPGNSVYTGVHFGHGQVWGCLRQSDDRIWAALDSSLKLYLFLSENCPGITESVFSHQRCMFFFYLLQ